MTTSVSPEPIVDTARTARGAPFVHTESTEHRVVALHHAVQGAIARQSMHCAVLIALFTTSLCSILGSLYWLVGPGAIPTSVSSSSSSSVPGFSIASTVFQGIVLVSVISLLVVRRSDLGETAQNDANIHRIRERMNFLKQSTLELRELEIALGLSGKTKEGMLRLLASDPKLLLMLDDSKRESVEAYIAELDQFDRDISRVKDDARRLGVSWDRVIVGHGLAAVTMSTAWVPFFTQSIFTPPTSKDLPYLALGMISSACAASAHALLGRKRTNEATFVHDLRSLGEAVGAITGMSRPALRLSSIARESRPALNEQSPDLFAHKSASAQTQGSESNGQ